jgi:hypothetical protein
MTTRERVLEGLEILTRGTARGLFPDSIMPAIHEAIAYVLLQAGLAALNQVPPDDRFPDHAKLEAELRQALAGMERGQS